MVRCARADRAFGGEECDVVSVSLGLRGGTRQSLDFSLTGVPSARSPRAMPELTETWRRWMWKSEGRRDVEVHGEPARAETMFIARLTASLLGLAVTSKHDENLRAVGDECAEL